MKKRLTACLMVAILLATTTVKADTTQTVNSDTVAQATVTVNIDSSYSVTVPKDITLDSTGNGTYSVVVSGDIVSNKVLKVEPVDADAGTDGINFKMSEALGVKTPLTVTVTQTKTSFTYSDVAAGDTASGALSCANVSAGNWSGQFNFNISLADA